MSAEIERACAALVQAFAYHVDRHENEALLALFTSDGQFNRPDAQARGIDALRAMLAARPTHLVSRHLCQPPYFLEVGEAQVRSVTAFTMYRAPVAAEGPAKAAGPALVGDYVDIFVATEAGWRIARRDVSMIVVIG